MVIVVTTFNADRSEIYDESFYKVFCPEWLVPFNRYTGWRYIGGDFTGYRFW